MRILNQYFKETRAFFSSFISQETMILLGITVTYLVLSKFLLDLIW
ncbi:hypothetical protein IT568_10560 [bacterium]|nr:hypothetical protein [bacterium]